MALLRAVLVIFSVLCKRFGPTNIACTARRTVLLFPPVNSRRRLLIHRCCEGLGLASFSVGCGEARRTAVAPHSDVVRATPAMGLSHVDRRTSHDSCQGAAVAAAGGDAGAGGAALAQRSPAHAQHDARSVPPRQRRPDRAVYVPRARRSADGAPSPCPAPPAPPAATAAPTSQPTTPRKSLDRKPSRLYTPPHLRSSPTSPDDDPGAPDTSERVPSRISAILYSDSSFDGRPQYVDFCDNSNLGVDLSDSDRRRSFDYAPAADGRVYDALDASYVDYNDRNSNFYADNIPVKGSVTVSCGADVVSELNMSVPDPNDTGGIINSDSVYGTKDDVDRNELRRASQEINKSNRRIIKHSYNSDVLVISDPVEPAPAAEEIKEKPAPEVVEVTKKKLEARASLKREENDWEAVFDDDGECLDPTLLEELSSMVGKVRIAKPKNSYDAYLEKGLVLDGEEFGHVVEVYDFPSEFKTNDLLSVFSEYKDSGFEIKWVDDTHALVVFSSTKIAAEVMSNPHPMVRCRPLRDATADSRGKAKRCAQFLQPYRQRPETCTALARRLVSGALGVKLSTARQERAEERRLIGIAREKKRQAALHKEAAWDGSLADSPEPESHVA